MRIIIKTSIIIVLAMALSFVANPILAQQRWEIIEMGESCQEVRFKMSEEECAAEDAEKARLEEMRAVRKKEESMIRFVNFEMCESGQKVSFPMSAEEMQKAIAREAGQFKKSLPRDNELQVEYDEHELCESGEKIIFYKSE